MPIIPEPEPKSLLCRRSEGACLVHAPLAYQKRLMNTFEMSESFVIGAGLGRLPRPARSLAWKTDTTCSAMDDVTTRGLATRLCSMLGSRNYRCFRRKTYFEGAEVSISIWNKRFDLHLTVT